MVRCVYYGNNESSKKNLSIRLGKIENGVAFIIYEKEEPLLMVGLDSPTGQVLSTELKGMLSKMESDGGLD